MGSEELFCLKWNNFQQCIKSTFQDLRDEVDFMDVTLCCDGEQFKAHKVILSACSVTLKRLLKKNPAPNPIIMLWDVLAHDLRCVLDFMYNGEVNVKQEQLNSFLSVAERLKVRGLCLNDGSMPSSKQGSVRHIENHDLAQLSKRFNKGKPPQGRSGNDSSKKGGQVVGLPTDFNGSDSNNSGGENVPDSPNAKRIKLTSNTSISGSSLEGNEVMEVPSVKQEQRSDHLPRVESETLPLHSSLVQFPVVADHLADGVESGQLMAYRGEQDDYQEQDYYDEDLAFGVDPMSGGEGALSQTLYPCPYCDKGFRTQRHFRVHVRNVHENAHMGPLQCELCPRVFKSKNSLYNHKSLYHKGQKKNLSLV